MANLIQYICRPAANIPQGWQAAFEVVNTATRKVVTVIEDERHAVAFAGSLDQVVAEVGGRPVLRGQLHEAFELVKPADGWKHPIDCQVRDDDLAALPGADGAADGLAMLREAVVFFTGSQLHVLHTMRGGCINKSAQPDVHHVAAKGYYLALGA